MDAHEPGRNRKTWAQTAIAEVTIIQVGALHKAATNAASTGRRLDPGVDDIERGSCDVAPASSAFDALRCTNPRVIPHPSQETPVPNRILATRSVAALCSTVLLAGALAACGNDTASTTSATTSIAASATTSTLVVDDGWVKAVDAIGAMSAMFGTLRNTSDRDITITGGSSPAARVIELHETVKSDSGQMQMHPKQGGFVVPAGGTYVLQPGGDHVMLMELTGALLSGTSTTVTLSTASGDVVLTVPVRAFAGAEESYVPTPSAT